MERNEDRQQQGDSQEDLDRALQRQQEDLAGDIETDRNLTGSTTYETLPDQSGDEGPTRREGGQ